MARFKVEVIADTSGKWAGNAVTQDTFEEAKEYAIDLAYRWVAVRCARVVEFEGDRTIQTTVVWGE